MTNTDGTVILHMPVRIKAAFRNHCCAFWLTTCLLCAEARALPSSVQLRVAFISSTSSFSIFSFWASCWLLWQKHENGREASVKRAQTPRRRQTRLTLWPCVAAPRSPLPASGCCPPCRPTPASSSSPPPGAFGCSSGGQPHNGPALMSRWWSKHRTSQRLLRTFLYF